MNKKLQIYHDNDIETKVMGASPVDLIIMLYDGVQTSINKAKFAIDTSNNNLRINEVNKAVRIINEGLMSNLDFNKGGEISENLSLLYQYIINTLLNGSIEKSKAKLDEASSLVDSLKSAWTQIKT